MSEKPALHVYKVGIMSNVATVKAPTAAAAAIWYGMQTTGNMPFGAVVYEQDGEKYEGPSPWLSWQFGKATPTEEELLQIRDDMQHCRRVREGK